MLEIVNSMVALLHFGYDIIDKKYVINEEESKIIKKIFEEYIDGQGILEIASNLNLEGFRTKKGKEFGKNSIYDIISNERYTGVYIFNKGTKNNHNRTSKSDNEIRIEDGIPSIISKEIFKKAMEKRKQNKQTPGEKSNKNVYLLSGLIYCGNCGARYIGSTSTKKKNNKTFKTGYYKCSNRNKLGKCENHIIKQLETENIVYDCLFNKIMNGNSYDELLDKIKIEYKKLKDDSKSNVQLIEKQLKTILEKKQNIINVISETGNIDLVKQLEILSEQQELLEDKLEVVKLNSDIDIPFEKIQSALDTDLKILKDGSKESIKKIIQKYIKRIIVNDDTLQIDYTFTTESIINLSNTLNNINSR